MDQPNIKNVNNKNRKLILSLLCKLLIHYLIDKFPFFFILICYLRFSMNPQIKVSFKKFSLNADLSDCLSASINVPLSLNKHSKLIYFSFRWLTILTNYQRNRILNVKLFYLSNSKRFLLVLSKLICYTSI